MNTKEYDQKKQECWEEYFKHVVCGTDSHEYWFNKIFDCAFALGKEKEPITQEEIEKVAQERADNILHDYRIEEMLRDDLRVDMINLFKDAIDFALGKQEKDADTVIQGWVCRDKKDSALNLHAEEPYRAYSHYQTDDEPDWWESDCASFLPLDKNLFPDLSWSDEPQEVELIIKRKKK